ncbi:MAG TPA: spermidine/putrescine ABC transporter substrate-binding protein [Tepidisphaeraceae bacterium]|jgi:spermidine/putrescine transport system substrate-binding protein|nr:spermidine/putrescine ABC transporter substrate-binding protein [Tepidisphaeraceae bacterium]
MRLSKWILAAIIAFPGSIARAADLNLFAWSEYVPQEVIDGFTKQTGINVHYETYASNEEMVSKLLAGASKYDLIQPSDYMAEALIKKHKLAAIDWSQVPNIKNIADEFRHLPGDPHDEFTVPWMTGTVGIVVNTDRVKDPIHGYNDVFQDKFKSRIVVVNDSRELVSWALSTLHLPINNITEANLEQTRPILTRWVKLIRVFDSDSPKTALLNGDVDLGIVWSGEAALCWNQSHKFQYILPNEGAHRFIDLLAIPANAPHKSEAQQFMNYILRPEVSKLISDKFPYTNPNAAARKLLTKEQLENPASYPKDDQKLDLFRDIGKQSSAIDRLVTEVKSAG